MSETTNERTSDPGDPGIDPIIGIDLGTTNTVAAVASAGGGARVITDQHGFKVQPSVVSFHPGGAVIVGDAAKQRRVIDPHNTVYSVKRIIGRTFRSPEVAAMAERAPFRIKQGVNQQPVIVTRGGEFAIPEISAIVLDHIRGMAQRALGRDVSRAVVTVPANFTDAQRSATATAGAIAGITVVRVLNEPTAAALAYGHRKRLDNVIAVYDFGGGTFDVTLLRMRDQVYEVLGTAGDSFLGGDDIDERLADHMVQRFLEQERIDLRGDEQAMQRLRAVAEQTKVELSRRARAKITIEEIAHGAGGRPLTLALELTREELIARVTDILDRSFAVCEEAVAIAGIQISDIHDVVLVGGTTKMPHVRERVAAFFGRAPRTDVNPEEAVAVGAALQGMALGRVLGGTLRRETASARITASTATAAAATTAPASRQPAATVTESGRITAAPVAPDESDAATAPDEPAVPTAEPDEPTVLDALEIELAPPTASRAARAATAPGAGPMRAPGPTVREPDTERAAGEGEVEIELEDDEILTDDGDDGGGDGDGDDGDGEPRDDEPAAMQYGLELEIELPDEPTSRLSLGAAIFPDDGTGTGRFQRVSPPRPLAPPAPLASPAPPDALAPPQPFTRLPPTSPTAAIPSLGPDRLAESPDDGSQPIALDGGREAVAPGSPTVLDVMPHSLGIGTVAGYCDGLILRNTRVPVQMRRMFTTSKDRQETVRIRVCQGESRRIDDNVILGDLVLERIEPRPRGETQIEVTFAIDDSGILTVRALDCITGHEQRVTLTIHGAQSPAEVEAAAARLRQLRG